MPHRLHFRQLVPVIALAATALVKDTYAQFGVQRLYDYTIEVNGSDGTQPTQLSTGGYNKVIVASADIRGTGETADYYVFDRAGDVHTVLGVDPANPGTLIDRSELASGWPRVRFFSIMRDYNRDGVPDLFVSSAESGREGLHVYTGERVGGRIVFRQADFGGRFGQVLAFNRGGVDELIYVLRTDLCAIEDLDGDGDLDVLAFDASGSFIWFYRNISVGVGADPSDHLGFELADRCYGGIFEDAFSAEIELASGPGLCAQGFRGQTDSTLAARGGIHPGSTITPYDADCDGDLDLFIGDIASSTISLLSNTPGTDGRPYYSSINTAWPGTPAAPSARVEFFPAAYVIDPLDRSATSACGRAVIVAPSNSGGAEDKLAQVYYTRNASGGLIQETRQLFSGVSFDQGTGAHFAFSDITGDGITDLLVGADYAYDASQIVPRRLSLRFFRGSSDQVFTEESPTWLRNLLAAIPPDILHLDPVFADLTGDGKPDLLLGNSSGSIAFAENRTVGSNVSFGPLTINWQQINVGLFSSPAVSDINGDGLLDLVIGEGSGNLNLYLNRGTRTAPLFASVAEDEFYGRIDARQAGVNGFGYSRPTFATLGGQRLLYLGTATGRLKVYGNLPSGEGGQAELLIDTMLNIGNEVDPAFTGALLSSESQALLWIGNQRGGFTVFATEGTTSVGQTIDASTLHVFPNPSNGQFQINGLPEDETYGYQIFDMMSRVVRVGTLSTGIDSAITVDEVLPKGVYVLEVTGVVSARRHVSKLLIQ